MNAAKVERKEIRQQVQSHQNAEEKTIFSKLRMAIERGVDAVKSLVEMHQDVIIQNKLADKFDGLTLIHVTTITGNLKMVEMLLEILPDENLEMVHHANQKLFCLLLKMEQQNLLNLL
ncbi:hypothetical protein M5689_020137 [Euphorbia peplus]|nr:hypothetical protein M5689_020137 [Euphorbia peplus]